MAAVFDSIDSPIARPDRAGLALSGGGRKIVLHTTEGGASSLPFDWKGNGWYQASGYIPNYTVSIPLRQWHRHLPNDKGAYTLVDGNRWGDRVIQIEVCGRAATIDTDFSTADWVWFGETLRQLCDSEGIPWVFAQFVAYPASYGLNAWQRMSKEAYTSFAGVCGHQHVPFNDHGDLGAVPVAIIEAAGLPSAPPLPVPDPTPIEDEDMKELCYTYRDVRYHNVWFVSPGAAMVLAPKTAAFYNAAGIPRVEDNHDATLAYMIVTSKTTTKILQPVT
jgi:hypothetical protein